MRVLLFVHTYREKNGIASHVQNLARSMPKGVQCEVISGGAFSLPFFSGLKFPLSETWKALASDFDVMHIHGYGNFFSFFGAIVAALKGKPLVWTVHGYPRIIGARRLFYYVYRYLMAPFIFWKACRIISVSHDAKKLLEKETAKRIEMMPNGVDLRLFRPGQPYRKQKYAAYVGRLDPDKGVMRMLECSSLPILFIGPDEGGTKEKLRAEAKRLGRHATFEEVPLERMPSAYEKCRYVILPSKYEGFPMTLLESVAMERPFISTDVGEVKATLAALFGRPEKFILQGSLQQKISQLEKEDLSSEMKSARKKAEKYSWGSIAARMAAIYRECAGKK
ncbi:D-inositol-3-phosphate glycosyltransferase [uncultured archaeon]|nr:D-inositol-3-phosphate glycosyltransferase [uncultured archaeon]